MFTTQMARRFRNIIAVVICFYFVASNAPTQAKFSHNAFPIAVGQGTFTDHQYGFRFTYPVGWQVTMPIDRYDQPDPMVIRRRIALHLPTQKLTEIRVDIWENTESLALAQWFDKYIHPLYSLSATLLRSPDISIAGAPGILIYKPAHTQSQGRMTALTMLNQSIISVDYYTNDGGDQQMVFLDIVRSLSASNRLSTQTANLSALPNTPLLSSNDATIAVQSCCGWTDPNINTYPCDGGNCTWWAKYKRPDVANTWGNALSWRDRYVYRCKSELRG